MGKACHVCNHPKRLEIDRQLIQGISHTKISREYEVSASSVRSHAENHISRQLVKSQEMKQAVESAGLVTEIEDLLRRSKKILNSAERDGKLAIALGAIRETRGTLELMAKICATIYQIQAQELQAQQSEHDESVDVEMQARLKLLSDAELSMLTALNEKMCGLRKDDVVQAVVNEYKNSYFDGQTLKKRIRYRRRVHATIDDNEEWTDEKEQQAQDEERAHEQEQQEEAGKHIPLDLESLNLHEDHAKAGIWGRKEDAFARAVVPGSIRTQSPELRRIFDFD